MRRPGSDRSQLLDRPDLQYAAKGVAKCMARPKQKDWLLLKRVGRYLKGACRMVQLFEWQALPDMVAAYTDSDWAGDRESRKSTSGGLLMLGKHLIKSWSSTQKVIALSSGEAELYALLKGATQAKGLMSMLYDWNIITQSIVNTDLYRRKGCRLPANQSQVGCGTIRRNHFRSS